MKIMLKMVLGYVLLAAIVLTLFSYLIYEDSQQTIENTIKEHLIDTVDSRALHIESVLQEEIDDITNNMARNPDYVKFLEKPGDLERFEETKEHILNELKDKDILEINIIDLNGTIVLSSTEEKIGLYRGDRDYFIKGLKGEYIEKTEYSETFQTNIFEISAPIKHQETNELMGLVEADISMEKVNKITTGRNGLGETGEIYIVNKEGFMITESRFIENAAFNLKINTVNSMECITKGSEVTHEHTLELFDDYRGVEVLGTHQYIDKFGWCILAEIDESEAFGVYREQMFQTVFWFGLYMLLIIISFSYMLSKKITDPLNSLRNSAYEIGKGKLDTPINIKTNDEVNDLADQFKKMTNKLKQYYSGLENEVVKRTKESEKRRIAALNLLEDLNETKKKLEKSNKTLHWETKQMSENINAFAGIKKKLAAKNKKIKELEKKLKKKK